MKMIHTAWRNMWRNTGRTILSATAIFLSSLVICIVISLEAGFVNDMSANVTNHVTGDIRVMSSDYVLNERVSPLQFFVENTDDVLDILSNDPLIELATPKTDFGVSIYRKGEQIPARAIGIDFAISKIIHDRGTRLLAGKLPSPGSAEVLITSGLAEEFGIRLDDASADRFTAITRTAIGGSNGRTFTVSGIVALADTDFSNRVLLMDWNSAGEFLRMNGNTLSVQVFLKDKKNGAAAAIALAHSLEGRALDVRSWYAVNSLYEFFTMANLLYAFIAGMFYALASTVIFNTTMMSVLERKKEIGTLGALGMAKRDLVNLFLLESGLIATLGSAGGTLAGFAVVNCMNNAGFDVNSMGGTSLSGLSISQIIYPSLTLVQYMVILLAGVTISLLACYFPSRMAASVEPAVAIADR